MMQTTTEARTAASSPDLRTACAGLASSSATVTLRDREGVRGVAAESFATISLDPPLIQLTVGSCLRTHEQLLSRGRFVINLFRRARPAWLERAVTGGGDARCRLGGSTHDLADGLPVLDDAHVALVCRVVDAYPADDHTLIIGQVEQVERRDDAGAAGRPPLRLVQFTSQDWQTTEWPPEMDFAC